MIENRALVVVPLLKEFAALHAAFTAMGLVVEDGNVGRVRTAGVAELGLLLAVSGHGKTQTAIQSQYLIDRMPGVHTLVCAGAAGALSQDLAHGDVVAGTASIEHDYKERFVIAPAPVHLPAEDILRQLRDSGPGEDRRFSFHFGPIASGDEDVVERERAVELAATGALCVAWEGSGAARVADFNELRFLELRVITDGADADASVTFEEKLTEGMRNIGDVLVACWKALSLNAT